MSTCNSAAICRRNSYIANPCISSNEITAFTSTEEPRLNEEKNNSTVIAPISADILERWAGLCLNILHHRHYRIDYNPYTSRATNVPHKEPHCYFNFKGIQNVVVRNADLEFRLFRNTSIYHKKNACPNNICCKIKIKSIYERTRLLCIIYSLHYQLAEALERANIKYNTLKLGIFSNHGEGDGDMTTIVRYIEPPPSGLFETQLTTDDFVSYCPDPENPNTYYTVFANEENSAILTEPVNAQSIASMEHIKRSIGNVVFKLERGQVVNNVARIMVRLLQISIIAIKSETEYAQYCINEAKNESFGHI